MSNPISSIIRHMNWVDTLSMDQVKDLCRAAGIVHADQNKEAMANLLKANKNVRSLNSATVASLKDMCRSRSLPVSGIKYQLFLRVLAHDTLTSSTWNERELCVEKLWKELEGRTKIDSSGCCWLAEKMEDIRYATKQAHGLDFGRSSRSYQFPLAAFDDARTVIAVFTTCCTPNAGSEYHDSLWTAINHLGFVVEEARVFMHKSEKKTAVDYILKLDNFLSEFMLDDNPKKAFHELVKLLKNDSYHLSKSALDPKKTNDITPPRKPFQCLMNDGIRGPNKSIAVTTGVRRRKTETKKKPKAKVVTNKKEIVYKKMTDVLKKYGGNSNDVYERLVTLLKSITRQYNYYDALGLYRSAFMALTVHFEKMNLPEFDTDHNFTCSIELLGDVLEEVLYVLSTKEKKDTIRWMTDLQTLTSPHCLGEIAEMPLCDLISMVKDSMPKEETRRFFFP